MHSLVVPKRVHRALAADKEDSVVVVEANGGERLRLLDQLHVPGRVDEAEADQILGRVPGHVARIAPRVGMQRTAIRACNLDLIAVLSEPKNGCASSAHQKPIGPPVCWETAGFDATITIRFGRSGLRMSTLALTCRKLRGGVLRTNTNGISG
jgi:hypothetical protein